MDRRRPLAFAFLGLVALTSCGSGATMTDQTSNSSRAQLVQAPARPSSPPVATDAVGIHNFLFGPAAITVPVGSTVTWTNGDVEQHTVTARDRAFDSDAIAGDKTFAMTFNKAGSFDYFCQIHPQMVGLVVVTDR